VKQQTRLRGSVPVASDGDLGGRPAFAILAEARAAAIGHALLALLLEKPLYILILITLHRFSCLLQHLRACLRPLHPLLHVVLIGSLDQV